MRKQNGVRELVKKKIEENRDQTVGFLRDLIRTQSVTGRERDCAEVCAERLKRMGLKIDKWEPDARELRHHPAYNDVIKYPPLDWPLSYENRPIVVGICKGNGHGKSIILNGHMDVVSPEPLSNWKHDPWAGDIEGDKLFGRGALDMKGGLTASIMALQSILDAGIELQGDVLIECVIEEEVGVGNGTLASLLKGYKADACIVTEPSGLQIGRSMRGGLYFRITVQGKSFHGVEKWKGKDAIELGTKLISELKSLETTLSALESHPLYDVPISIPITPDKIHGGTWKGMVAPQCTIEGYFETLPGKSLEEWENTFRKCIKAIADRDPWLRENPPKIEFTEKYQPYEIPADDPFVQIIAQSYSDIIGSNADIIGVNGGCDATVRANYGHSSTVVFGPSGSNWHGADEYVSLESVVDVEKVIAETILNWCGDSAQDGP